MFLRRLFPTKGRSSLHHLNSIALKRSGGAPCNKKPFAIKNSKDMIEQSNCANTVQNCSGCGIRTQSDSPTEPGYLPEQARARFSSGWLKTSKRPRGTWVKSTEQAYDVSETAGTKYMSKSLKLLCMSCYRLQNYRKAVIFPVDETAEVHEPMVLESIVKRLPDDAVVISVVDVLNFESSIVPELYDALSKRRIRVVTVLNKLDCLPIREDEWNSILQWGLKCSRILRKAVASDGSIDVIPISSDTEQGFDVLERRLAKYISVERPRSVFVLGRVNSGKSSLVNRFMRYIGYKHMGCVHYKRKVGGLTRSPIPGTTQDFIRIPVGAGVNFFDTPGIPSIARMESHMSNSRDFLDLASGKRFQPVTYSLREGKTLLIGSMCRVEVASGSPALLTCFVSPDVTLHICNTDKAQDLLTRKAGTFLYPPHSQTDGTPPSIMSKNWLKHRVRVLAGPSISHDDISIPGLGWISVNGQGRKDLDVWVPQGVRIFRRPSMLPRYVQRHGSSRFSFRLRARGLKVNKIKKKLVHSLREEGKRELWRKSTLLEQESHSAPVCSGTTDEEFTEIQASQAYKILD